MSIVVTAASGQLGRLVVESLLERGVVPTDIVATARDVSRLEDLAERGVSTAVLDYGAPGAEVIGRGDTVLLVSGTEPDRVAQHRAVIELAAGAGAERVAYTSAIRADHTTLFVAPDHAATEVILRASGVPFTILRNSWYNENYRRPSSGLAGPAWWSPARPEGGSPAHRAGTTPTLLLRYSSALATRAPSTSSAGTPPGPCRNWPTPSAMSWIGRSSCNWSLPSSTGRSLLMLALPGSCSIFRWLWTGIPPPATCTWTATICRGSSVGRRRRSRRRFVPGSERHHNGRGGLSSSPCEAVTLRSDQAGGSASVASAVEHRPGFWLKPPASRRDPAH